MFGLDFAVEQSRPIKDLVGTYWLVLIVVLDDIVEHPSVDPAKAELLQGLSLRIRIDY